MAKQKKQNVSGSWLISIILHGIIILVLLITTSKTISNHIDESPPARIVSTTEEIQLQENMQIQELALPDTSAVFSNEIPDHNYSDINLSSLKPISIVSTSNRLQKTTSVPASSLTSRSVFFGTSGDGERICYLVDVSGSMIMAIEYIKKELINSVARLTPDQYFQIIFYADEVPVIFSPESLTRASYYNRQKAADFIRQIDVQAVRPDVESWRPVLNAMRAGFESVTFDNKPANLVYLFTDGDFDYTIINPALSSMQKSRKLPAILNVLLCGSMDNEQYLIKLANKYRGQYRFLTDDQLVNPQSTIKIPEYLRFTEK